MKCGEGHTRNMPNRHLSSQLAEEAEEAFQPGARTPPPHQGLEANHAAGTGMETKGA